jgi:hypothetical protein
MIMPAWFLLVWSGLAAACVAALFASAVGGVSVAAWSLAPVPRSRSHGAAWSLAAGMVIYPVAYGFVFELLERADLRTGLILGALHGASMFAVARRRASSRAGLRATIAHFVYAVAIAFLYITP